MLSAFASLPSVRKDQGTVAALSFGVAAFTLNAGLIWSKAKRSPEVLKDAVEVQKNLKTLSKGENYHNQGQQISLLRSDEAVLRAASELSEVIFVSEEDDSKKLKGSETKCVVQVLNSMAGSGNMAVGSAASGVDVAIYTSSLNLKMMLPSLFEIASKSLPLVVHVKAHGVSDNYRVESGGMDQVQLLLDSGFTVISTQSKTPQEAHDNAVLAHLVAKATSTPVLNIFDGYAVKDLGNVSLVSKTILDSGLVEKETDVRQAFEQVSKDAKHLLKGKKYGFFEYFGSPKAKVVIVTTGSHSAEFGEGSTKFNLSKSGEDEPHVGVLSVRLLRPWSTTDFLAELPETVGVVCVLGTTKNQSALARDVATALLSKSNETTVLNGTVLGEVTPSIIDAVFRNAVAETPERNFTLGTQPTAGLDYRSPLFVNNKETLALPEKQAGETLKEDEILWKFMFPQSYSTKSTVHPSAKEDVHLLTLTENRRLTPASYHRNVFHLEFSTKGTGLTYEIGDALGVYGQNNSEEVSEFLSAYGKDILNPDAFVQNSSDNGSQNIVTVKQLFTSYLDIFGKPSQAFYADLSKYATDDYEQRKLEWIGTDWKEGFKLRQLETVTFADVLLEFPSARPSLPELMKLIPNIKPRHYSIASSMKANPGSVHLLVVLVEWETRNGRKRYGQCSKFLADCKPGTRVAVDIMPSILRLPKDPKAPIIMAGLGTGMAPFRAFLQERVHLKKLGVEVGEMVLYFGARHRAQEYLYGNELDEYARQGHVTLRLAFSRDQKKKVYIQHKIVEDAEHLGKLLLEKNGNFYLCGPTWPVPDIAKALKDGFEVGAGLSAEKAKEQLDALKSEGRYVLEVY